MHVHVLTPPQDSFRTHLPKERCCRVHCNSNAFQVFWGWCKLYLGGKHKTRDAKPWHIKTLWKKFPKVAEWFTRLHQPSCWTCLFVLVALRNKVNANSFDIVRKTTNWCRLWSFSLSPLPPLWLQLKASPLQALRPRLTQPPRLLRPSPRVLRQWWQPSWGHQPPRRPCDVEKRFPFSFMFDSSYAC